MTAEADRFWRFSVTLYGQPGVAPACLALQDEMELDVNILLFCCFAAAEGASPVGRNSLLAAERAVAPWRSVAVEPLRAVRRAMKAAVAGVDSAWRESVRTQVQAAELESERIVQSLIAAAIPLGEGRPAVPAHVDTAAANVADYLTLRDAIPNARQRDGLAHVIAAGMGDATAEKARASLERALPPRGEER